VAALANLKPKEPQISSLALVWRRSTCAHRICCAGVLRCSVFALLALRAAASNRPLIDRRQTNVNVRTLSARPASGSAHR
jgi:hypothetical protein